MCFDQRQHTANILEAPKAYEQQSPAKPSNIIVMDCRGLEFTEFKADVGQWLSDHARLVLTQIIRENGRLKVQNPAPPSLALI